MKQWSLLPISSSLNDFYYKTFSDVQWPKASTDWNAKHFEDQWSLGLMLKYYYDKKRGQWL